MISVAIENGAATFRIGKHVFPVTEEECRMLGESLAMTGQLGAVINDAAEWILGTRWKLERASLYDDRRNRLVLHCDGKSWHLLHAEVEKLAAAFAAAAPALRER